MTLINALLVVVGLAGLDFVFGCLNALKTHTFNLQKLAEHNATTVLPYIGSFVAVAIPQVIQPDGSFSSAALFAAALTVAGTASLKLAQDVARKALALAG